MTSYEKTLEHIHSLEQHHGTKVQVVAVSKYVGASDIQKLYGLGARCFGENKVQDLVSKQSTLRDFELDWHFLGRLQTNKINHLLRAKPSLMHSLDSMGLAHGLQKRLEREGTCLDVLMQINSANESSKAGFGIQEARESYDRIAKQCPNIKLKGVMSIGALSEDNLVVAKSFEQTYKIFDDLRPFGAEICSMGMSGDYALAIACGSNLVRLGSILFEDI